MDDWNPLESTGIHWNPLATQVMTGAVVDLLQRRLRSFPAEEGVQLLAETLLGYVAHCDVIRHIKYIKILQNSIHLEQI